MPLPRLRQVALAAESLAPVAQRLTGDLGLTDPFRDEGVAHFGLENAVFAIGDTFLEVVSPVQPDTTAGRYLQRRGGDSGYMALFQLADITAARERLSRLGVRIVWESEHPDIVDLHLHPKDVPGAIVALDAADPPGSWRWGGPGWVASVPAHAPGGILGITVAAVDPRGMAQRWADVLGLDRADGLELALDGGRQAVRFTATDNPAGEGIVAVRMALPYAVPEQLEICGVSFELSEVQAA